jgi:hypothetical protein
LGPEFVIQSLTPGPKDVKMDWAHSNLRRLLQSRSTYLAQFGHAKEGKEPKSGGKVKAKNETRDVTFRKREMWLLHRIDQVLATDYYTRLVPLSDFLCRISMSSLEDLLDEMVMGGGRVQMQFVFAALERHVAKDKDTSDFSDRLEPHKIEPLKHSTEAGLEALRRGIEDLETLPKKEDPW